MPKNWVEFSLGLFGDVDAFVHLLLPERDKPRQGVVASTLNLSRNGAVGFIDWLGLRRNAHGALDRSRVACDLERVEILLELNGPAAADRPDVDHLCVAFLSLPVKSEAIVAESHNSLAPVGLKDLVRVKDEFVEARR